MRWPSFLRQFGRPATPPATGAGGPPVQVARTQARRRLVGAVVLLGLGVVAFPLVFETQPRPLPADLPIEPPGRDSPPAQRRSGSVLPAEAPTPASAVRADPPPKQATVAEARDATPAQAQEPAPAPMATPAPAPSPAPLPAPSPAPAPAPAARPAPKPPPPPPAEPRPAAAGAPAPGSAPAAAAAPAPAASNAARYVLQVGAYAEAATVRDVRARIEKLGLKTYTQVVETDSGARTRVRIGPFDSRAEAVAAGERLKSAGLPFNLLTL